MDVDMNHKSALLQMYSYDSKTNTITIPMRLKTFADLYNPIDPSPSPSRDLSEEVVDYLNQCSDEIALKFNVEISIELGEGISDTAGKAECAKSIRSFFIHEIFVCEHQKSSNRKAAFRHLMVSLTCLSIYVISQQITSFGIIFDIIKEAILIGGWVFMWESVTHNFIQIEPIDEMIRRYQRIIDAPIHFHQITESK